MASSEKKVRRRSKGGRKRDKDTARKAKQVAGSCKTRTGGKAKDRIGGKDKKSKKLSVSVVVGPKGTLPNEAKALNDLMDVPSGKGFGCLYCKFYQFSRRRKSDLNHWRGTKAKKIKHRTETWGVKARGESITDINDWGRKVIRFKKPPKKADILFVGEAPGEVEDESGHAFTGPSGELLHNLTHVDTKIADNFTTRYSNVLRCRPWVTPSGKQKNPTISEAKHCSGFLAAEIEAVKPLVIVTLGGIALKAVLGNNSASISRVHGRLQKVKLFGRNVWVYPLYHPAYMLRNDHEIPAYIKQFRTLQRIVTDIKEKGAPRASKTKEAKYEIVDDPDRAIKIVNKMRKARKLVAYDIEAAVNFKRRNGKSEPSVHVKNGKIALVGLCNKPGEAYCIPVFHREVDWPKRMRKKVRKALRRLLQDDDVPKVAQNKKFDNTAFEVLWGFRPSPNVLDTMTDHYCLDETLGTHSLDHLTYQYLPSLAGYKEKIEPLEIKYSYDFTKIPLEKGGVYNCMDVDATLQISSILEKELKKDPQLFRLGRNFLGRLTNALQVIEREGVAVDLDAAERLKAKYENDKKKIVDELMTIPAVRRFQANRNRRIRQERKETLVRYDARMRPTKLKPVNFGSSQQVGEILYKYLGYPVETLTDNQQPSTDKRTLIGFAAVKDCRFSKLIQELRLIDRIIGTYIESIVHDVMGMRDGLLHGSFSDIRTTTGRLASASPNLQNFPNKGGGDVKRLFISRYDSPYDPKVVKVIRRAKEGKISWDDAIREIEDVGVILQYDYSQIELRILALFSRDPTMMKIYREGGDIHLMTTCTIFDITPEEYEEFDDKKKSEKRTIAKRVCFGLIYGSGAQGICNQLAENDPPIYISESKAQEYIDKFFRKYKGTRQWIDWVLRKLHRDEQLRSVTGRLRRLPEIGSFKKSNQARAERQGPNALIQSAASDVTLTSLILIVETLQAALKDSGLKTKVILTVHDSIVFDCALGELKQVMSIVEEIMTNIPKYGGIVWGEDFDWSWLEDIPVKVDGDVGPNYRDLMGFSGLGEKKLKAVGADGPDDPDLVYKVFATALEKSIVKDAQDEELAYGDAA